MTYNDDFHRYSDDIEQQPDFNNEKHSYEQENSH